MASGAASLFLCGKTLSIEDLNALIALLERHHYGKASYYHLGLRLLLSDNTLKSIEKEHKGQVDRCFTDCLASWLRKVDRVLNPTIDTLIAALRGIENAVADGIDEERQTVLGESLTTPPVHKTCVTYDGTCDPDASNEEHAVNIFNFRWEQLQCLNRPDVIANLLHEEKVLNDQDLKEVLDDVLKCKNRLDLLLIKIKIAISKDYKVLENFARVCMNTENNDLGNNILIDCDAAFKQSKANYEELCEVLGSSMKDVENKANESVKYLSNLTLVLKQRFCITLSTVNDCMAVVRRETTMFNTTLLEEVAFELGCKSTKKNIEKFNSAISIEVLCNVRLREPSYHATVETLSIAMSFDPGRSIADIHHILSKLFGNLRNDVRWHSNNDEGIVCYFDPVYATLLMDKIIKGFSFCKEKQIQTITVGYCTVYNETLCNEAYKKLEERMGALEERNSELEEKNEKLNEDVKNLKIKIDDLEKVNENLKKEAISLEDKLKEKESHIEELQSRLKEKLEMKDKIQRRTMQENEYLKTMICETKELEAMIKEREKEIELLQEKVSLLSCHLLQNESFTQKEINSLENENKALAKNLQQETALNKSTLQQLAKAEAEIGILQEKLTIETGKNIGVDTNYPSSKEATIKEETTNQPTPMPEYVPPAEDISISDSEIILTAPSLKTCKEIQIRQATLSLNNAFVDSASAILLQLPESITYLHINRTPLSHDSVHSIGNLLHRLKALRLTDVALPPTSLSYILNVLLTNESLEEFIIQFNSQMILPLSSTSASSYAQAISDVVRRNSTLQYFSALGLRLDEAGVVKILHALANNNITLRLLTLDQSHQETAYEFSEANGPIKDRLSFS